MGDDSATLGFAEFGVNAVPAFVVATIMVVIFCALRKKYTWVYEPRTQKVLAYFEKTSPDLPPGFIAWLFPTLQISFEETAEKAGCEAAGYSIFQFMMMVFFGILTLLCSASLMITFATGSNEGTEFDAVSMYNVSEGDDRLFVPAIFLWLVTLVLCACSFKAVRFFACLRDKENTRPRWQYSQHTVFVGGIPADKRTENDVRAHVDALCPLAVVAVQLVKHLGKDYEQWIKEYKTSWGALRHFEAVLEQSGKTPMTRTKPIIGKKVEAIAHHTQRCSELRTNIENRRAEFEKIDAKTCAFVTLKSLSSSISAVAKSTGPEWRICHAPEPRSIYWNAVVQCRSPNVSLALGLVMALVVGSIIILFMVPIGMCGALANVEALADGSSWLSWVFDMPEFLLALIQGLLPVIAVAVLNALVLPVFTALLSFSGVEDVASLTRRVLIAMFLFLGFNSFVVMMLSTSLLNRINDIWEDPGSLATLLGESLPASSTFFINFLTLSGIAGALGRVSCLGPLIVGSLKLKYLAKTTHEKQTAMLPPVAGYARMYAYDTFFGMLSLAFSVVAPIILPFGFLYFTFNFVTGKYLVTYVYGTPYHGGGSLMLLACQLSLWSLIICQCATILFLSLKDSYAFIVVVPLPFLTLVPTLLLSRSVGKTFSSEPITTEVPQSERVAEDVLPSEGKLSLTAEIALEKGWWKQESLALDLDNPLVNRFAL